MQRDSAEEVQTSVYRRMAPHERLAQAFALRALAAEIIRTREKRLYPELDHESLERRVRSFFR